MRNTTLCNNQLEDGPPIWTSSEQRDIMQQSISRNTFDTQGTSNKDNEVGANKSIIVELDSVGL